jgi:hypothetical protein
MARQDSTQPLTSRLPTNVSDRICCMQPVSPLKKNFFAMQSSVWYSGEYV